MRAHQLAPNGVITNTIVVDSLDVFPNLVDASIGGKIGDSIVDGLLIPAEAQVNIELHNAPILAALADIDRRSIRALRENDPVRIAALESEAEVLRAKLMKA